MPDDATLAIEVEARSVPAPDDLVPAPGCLTAAGAFRRAARSCLDEVRDKARAFRRKPDPETLHQLRVALRRWRSVLSAFKSVLSGERVLHVRSESRWLSGALNAARDLDVFCQTTRLDCRAVAGPDAAPSLEGRLGEAREEAYSRALEAAASPRFTRLLRQSAAWANNGDWTRPEDSEVRQRQLEPADAFAATVLSRLRWRLRKRGRGLAGADPDLRHRARLAAKKLRYAAEVLADLVEARSPRRRRRFLAAVKAVQDRLGELNDIAVAADVAVRAVGPYSPDLLFAAGEAVGRRRSSEPAMLKAASRAWRDFRDLKPFWKGV